MVFASSRGDVFKYHKTGFKNTFIKNYRLASVRVINRFVNGTRSASLGPKFMEYKIEEDPHSLSLRRQKTIPSRA